MSNYMYKTTAPAVVAAVIAWEAKRKEWDAQRAKRGKVFGGAASPMRSGSRSYVGGVKISDSRELDVHWRRPDQYDYRAPSQRKERQRKHASPWSPSMSACRLYGRSIALSAST